MMSEEETRWRKREAFRNRMYNFNICSAVTSLKIDDMEWPLIKGYTPYNSITGRSFTRDDPTPQVFNSNEFLDYTTMQMVACGAGTRQLVEATGAVELVLKRVMKTLNNYCNHMFLRAKCKNLIRITHSEVEDLLETDKFRFHLYFTHFYPIIRPDTYDVPRPIEPGQLPDIQERAPVFHNNFTAHLHRLYHDIPAYHEIYDSEMYKKALILKAGPVLQNTKQFSDENVREYGENFQQNSFVAPKGTRSVFYANRFYEALGMPPMEKEMILVFDWLARNCISEIVLKAISACRCRMGRLDTGTPIYVDYMLAFQQIDYFYCGDILGLIPMNFNPPPLEFLPEIPEDRRLARLYYRQRKKAAQNKLAHRMQLFQYHEDATYRHIRKDKRTISLRGYERERAR